MRGAAMAADELAYATIGELGARFRRRDLSPVELVRAQLERIEALDPVLSTFVTLTADQLLADALGPVRALDTRAEKPLEPAVTFAAAGARGGDGG
ncbi:MAG: hypothetical protein A3F92_09890 [Candidatus Rokubacteria bacterium RIFCSPLOWO2_12_FULL_71_22]|nr:MAG: hypothetical protein A3F92_09890 [Candidatus Rokubacteria bacterium RIFCSPLOWO2_12_FULL_71_22]